MYNAKESEIGVAQRLLETLKQAPSLAESLDLGFSLDARHKVVPWSHCGISQVVWVDRQGLRDGKLFEEMQCYLSNWSLDAETFVRLIQSHWQIENGLHWVKDVTLDEDYPPRRGGFVPISWAVINSFIITLTRRLKHRTVPDCIRDVTNEVERIFAWLT